MLHFSPMCDIMHSVYYWSGFIYDTPGFVAHGFFKYIRKQTEIERMSTQVKIVMAAINLACLIVTLAFPADVTPLILLTTIASTVSWAFTTQEPDDRHRKGLLIYIGLASFLAIVCIVFGVTASVIQPDPTFNPSCYAFKFDDMLVAIGGAELNYLWFAIPIFIFIVFLMVIEIYTTFIKDRTQNNGSNETLPLAKSIKQRLNSLTQGL